MLTQQSTKYANNPVADYTEKREQLIRFWKGANGQQTGDPAKLAEALIKIANEENHHYVSLQVLMQLPQLSKSQPLFTGKRMLTANSQVQ